MRRFLKIGELSKLLCISAYNIRYYEKEGLISPSHTSEAGYRLYDYDDVYQLVGIMILRDSNISIKQIKKLLKNYNKHDYLTLLKQSHQKVTTQIEKLTMTKNQLHKNIMIASKLSHGNTYEVRDVSKRTLKVLKRSNFEMNYSLKELFDIFNENNIDMSKFYKQDSMYYLTDDDISYCIIDNAQKYNLEEIELKAGKYLSYSYNDTKDNISHHIDELFDYIVKNEMRTQGDLVLLVKTSASMANEIGFMGELQIMLK